MMRKLHIYRVSDCLRFGPAHGFSVLLSQQPGTRALFKHQHEAAFIHSVLYRGPSSGAHQYFGVVCMSYTETP